MSGAQEMRPGDVVAFELSGGPGCGKVTLMPLKTGDTYLIGFSGPEYAGNPVWAYRFANRSTKRGWVLEADRCVGNRGTFPEKGEAKNG